MPLLARCARSPGGLRREQHEPGKSETLGLGSQMRHKTTRAKEPQETHEQIRNNSNRSHESHTSKAKTRAAGAKTTAAMLLPVLRLMLMRFVPSCC
jgi:hypothetical protein